VWAQLQMHGSGGWQRLVTQPGFSHLPRLCAGLVASWHIGVAPCIRLLITSTLHDTPATHPPPSPIHPQTHLTPPPPFPPPPSPQGDRRGPRLGPSFVEEVLSLPDEERAAFLSQQQDELIRVAGNLER